jgi:hypothetical protein
MCQEEKDYNYLHSSTRITVEMAFGRLKNRFRIFKTPLNQQTPEKMSEIIGASFVLHNWMIDLEAFVLSSPHEPIPPPFEFSPPIPWNNDAKIDGERAKEVRNEYREYLQTTL